MKFVYYKSSGGVDSEIEINTLEQLLDFVQKNGNNVIILFKPNNYKQWELEIYDDFRE